MSDLRLVTIASTDQLRAQAAAWDQLWQASDVVLPTLRANLLAIWLEHFLPRARLRMLAVEQDNRLVAALPLISRSLAPGLEIGEITGNYWSPAADLLLDPRADVPAALDVIVAELRRMRAPLVHFQAVDYQPPRWQSWLSALDRQGVQYAAKGRFPVSLMRIGGSWGDYVDSRSRNHKRQMRRVDRKAREQGGVNLRVIRRFEPYEVEPLLRRGFEVEDRNWKGQEGSSVLSSPGLFDFFLAQSRQLAAWGQLQLVFLENQGQPIAFEYGWLSKGVYQAVKIGYDDAFAHLTPGQLIRWHFFEQLHAEGGCEAVDFVGPQTRATGIWANDEYVLGRMVLAPGRLAGRLALHAYKNWWPRLRGKQHGENADHDTSTADAEAPEVELVGA